MSIDLTNPIFTDEAKAWKHSKLSAGRMVLFARTAA